MRALHLDQKGRGRALRAAWSSSSASVVAYMDVDLATGLDALLPLVAPLLSGHSDLAIGTRLAPGAHVVRGARREFISRAYNLLCGPRSRSACTDAQCGFKAMRRDAAAELLPLVEDEEWFFDTEVLVTAQRIGLRIHEVPVDWVDDLDSRVEVVPTALADLRGVWRMLSHRPARRGRSAVRPRRAPGPTGHRPGRVWCPLVRSAAIPSTGDRVHGTGRACRTTRRSSPTSSSGSPGWGGQHAGLRRPVRRARARTGQLRGQHGGHRPVQPRQHRRPPRHGRHGPSRLGRAAPGGGRGPARGQPGLHHGRTGRVTGCSGSITLVPELVAVTIANLAAAASGSPSSGPGCSAPIRYPTRACGPSWLHRLRDATDERGPIR